MRIPFRLLLLGLLPCLMPGITHAISVDEYRDLLTRTGFGARPSDLAGCETLSYDDAVQHILDGVNTEAQTPPPTWVKDKPPGPPALGRSTEENKQLQQERAMKDRQEGQELKAWWYREMLATDSPFTERMTLFWSNHFTSSLEKVKFPPFLYSQNVLLRRMALGNFSEMLRAIPKDPAMVLYLDSVSNRAGAPNENFARELMELFTLGIGNYTETDIKQSARAFTGYSLDRPNGVFRYATQQHDYGEKSFMGRHGDLTGADIINSLLENPQTSRHIVEKLWKEFISPTPDPEQVEQFAKLFRDGKYEIKPLMKAMLTSQAFRDPANRGTLVKSPVEFMVGTMRTFEVPMEDPTPLVGYGVRMGQDLFNPPNVKGWVGGDAWIDANTLLIRREFIQRAMRAQEMNSGNNMMYANNRGGGGFGGNGPLAPYRGNPAMRQRIQALRQQGMDRDQIKAAIEKDIAAGKFAPMQGQNGNGQGGPGGGGPPWMQNPELRQQAMALRQQGLPPDQIRAKVQEYAMAHMNDPGMKDFVQAAAKGNPKERMAERASNVRMPPADLDKWMTAAQQVNVSTAGMNVADASPETSRLEKILLALPPSQPALVGSDSRATLVGLMLDPVYQLK